MVNRELELNDELTIRINEQNEKSILPLLEDVAEWISSFMNVHLTSKNFLDELDNGVLLLQIAQKIQEQSVWFVEGVRKHLAPGVYLDLKSLPKVPKTVHINAQKESFFARDNVATFLKWARDIGINEAELFESNGLVLHQDLKNVILTFLTVGRIGSKYDLKVLPSIINLEKEIDQEETEESKNGTSIMNPENEIDQEEIYVPRTLTSIINPEKGIVQEEIEESRNLTSIINREKEIFEEEIHVPRTVTSITNPEKEIYREESNVTKNITSIINSEKEIDWEESNVTQNVTPIINSEIEIDQKEIDLRRNVTIRKKNVNLDGQVQKYAKKHNLKLTKVKEGKYCLNGKMNFLVRELRNHIMVRVGGGWDELDHFLSKHNPKKINNLLVSTPSRGCIT